MQPADVHVHEHVFNVWHDLRIRTELPRCLGASVPRWLMHGGGGRVCVGTWLTLEGAMRAPMIGNTVGPPSSTSLI